MTHSLQVFNSELGQVRTLEIEGKIWFVASDVAKALGYSNHRDAIIRHCKGVVKHDGVAETGVRPDGTRIHQQVEMNIIPEGDVYRLVGRSKLPSAEKFESWVFDEVLPSIRKTGTYSVVPSTYAQALLEAGRLALELEESQALIAQQQDTLDYQEPLVEIAVKRLSKDGCMSITDVNKTFGLKRGALTNYARELGMLHKTNTEVNQCGEEYFKVYDNNGYRAIGVTEAGIRWVQSLINDGELSVRNEDGGKKHA